MIPSELERYLHDHIPLTRAMQVAVIKVSDETVLIQAPLAPNINQHVTVFGGSASAVAIIAAWSLLHVRLLRAGIPAGIVIQRNTMEYLRPIEDDFTARAAFHGDATSWSQFTRMLARKGKARMEVTATLECEGQAVGRLVGDFVAFAGDDH